MKTEPAPLDPESLSRWYQCPQWSGSTDYSSRKDNNYKPYIFF